MKKDIVFTAIDPYNDGEKQHQEQHDGIVFPVTKAVFAFDLTLPIVLDMRNSHIGSLEQKV